MDLSFRPEELPPWLLRTELPTLVRECCENAQQISVWLAVRWLLGAERRKPIGSREIAERAKVDKKSVPKYTKDLERLGLLEIVGQEQIRNLIHPRPIYRIPRSIEERNAAFTLHFVTYEIHDAPTAPDPDQLLLPLSDALEGGVSDPKTDQTSDPKTDQTSDPKTDQRSGVSDPKTDQRSGVSDPKTDQTSDPKTDHGRKEGRNHGRKEGIARARKQLDDAPLPIPPSPPDQPPLPAHPIDLWRDACPNPRPSDAHSIALLAAEHDATSGGYGLYYVGRAILAASISEDVYSIAKPKKILGRWRDEQSYGSDRQTETTNGRSSHQNQGDYGRDRARRGNGGENRQPTRRGAARPGSPEYYERYRQKRDDSSTDGE